ncbi:urease accessory protein UreE [Oricola sp.]|uniref:urease accessory protein UreE n=1 Tax=Oricola sp. TaxID=1979950 RepID=UPI0025EB7753|nr:urease accessory protein UreE [Oricola sp.]MCI5076305.1 urease accessory protein UreE [Oricola sp.]
MPTASSVTRHFHNPAGTITLDETARHRRRMKMVSDNGIEFLLDLAEARLLRHGDGLMLDDGRVIEVMAAPEALCIVRGRDARHLLALAWQIGNRHLPAQIFADHILIRRDHVIRDMLEGLGASVTETEAAFDPEGGAYGDAHGAHGHDHHHHGHGHTHGDHDHADHGHDH